MEKEFVPYELAVKLKALGFDEPCFGFYQRGDFLKIKVLRINLFPRIDDSCLAPTFSQAFRWFREKGYHCGIIPRYDEFHYFIKDFVNDKEYDDVYNISSYEEAELACLRKLIEIVKENL
jgi:hypothetical protein